MKTKPSQCKPLDQRASQVKPIIHIHILTLDGKAAVFQRNCKRKRWSCISGELEIGESWESAARREALEETKLVIKHITLTNHFFFAESPKGKAIFGRTCYAIVSSWYLKSSGFHFNGELKKGLVLPYSAALNLMKKRGFIQSVEGFEFILKNHLFKTAQNNNHASDEGYAISDFGTGSGCKQADLNSVSVMPLLV